VPELVKVESEGDILSRVRKIPELGEKEGLKIGKNICFTLNIDKKVLEITISNFKMKVNLLYYGL